MDGRAPHVPVLTETTVRVLVLEGTERQDKVFVDATVGAGGHAERLLEASGPGTRLIGLDRDAVALDLAAERLGRFGDRVRLVRGNFDELEALVGGTDWGPVDGVLYDFGVSSMHLDTAGRGFSYREEAPLDMRMDQSQELTAADVVNTYAHPDLARIIRT
ncbi:MAG TPA: 16S rRNA (cytosine(1402)-N(4))-methyltransferase, partial [Actinomycetota bacterium]|nr:16S rRNA (cytosine(1402)-N(4))-methyltransferase [Actinomycetota bacterium]